MIILIGWYIYVLEYNQTKQGVFLVGTLPIWSLTPAEIILILDGISEHFKRDYFRPILYPFILGSIFIIFLNLKQLAPIVRPFIIFCILGVIVIQVLFFQPLKDHDYYSLDQLILFPILVGAAYWVIRNNALLLKYRLYFDLLLIGLLIHCADFTRRRIIDRYSGWMNYEYAQYMAPLGSISTHFESLGIPSQSKVICLPDRSFNHSLYLIDRRGWTDFDSLSFYPERMDKVIEMGAEFLVIYDPTIISREGIAPYIKRELEPFGHVRIFDLRE